MTDARLELAERLNRAMKAAWKSTERHPLRTVEFRNAKLNLPFHQGEEFSTDALLATLQDTQAATSDRILAAMGLSSRRRIAAGLAIDVPCVELEHVQIVLLPGEAFMGYQLMAQEMRPDKTVIAIGFGECWPGYIPTQAAFDDHFGHGWRWVDRGSESAVKQALRAVLDRSPPR